MLGDPATARHAEIPDFRPPRRYDLPVLAILGLLLAGFLFVGAAIMTHARYPVTRESSAFFWGCLIAASAVLLVVGRMVV